MQKSMVMTLTSGADRTSVTTRLTTPQRRADRIVQVYKIGPDYIDPQFHTAITGHPYTNLDPHFLGSSEFRETSSRYRSEADILLVEATMGLMDGITGQGDRVSALEIVRTLDAPASLLVTRGQKDEAAWKVETPAPENRARLTDVLLNEGGKDGTASEITFPTGFAGARVYGCLPLLRSHELKGRHSGLVVPLKIEETCRFARQMAEALRKVLPTELRTGTGASAEASRFGIARDVALSFLYPESLRVLTECGTEPVFFSPLSNCPPPVGLSGLWPPGDYPRFYAEVLSSQVSLREDIRDTVRGEFPTVAEYGGFMYLLGSLEDMSGIPYKTAGALTGHAFRTGKLQRFGYIEVWAEEEASLPVPGENLHGHEFHYWDATENDGSRAATRANGSKSWPCVRESATLLAGYPHLYLTNAAGRKAAARFAAAYRAFRRSREETTC